MNAVSWLEGFPAPDRWRNVLQVRGPQVAVWVLALAIAAQAAIIVTDLAGANPALAPPIAQTVVPVSAPQAPQHVDIVSIANSHLFGEAQTAPKSVDVTNAPPTTIPLVLAGIIAGNDPQSGFAIVGESSQGAKVYAVGDTMPGGARLHSVYDDRVLLDRGGNIEALALPRQYSTGRRAAAGVPPPPPTAGIQGIQPPVEPGGIVDRMRRLVQDDPGLISDIMRPQPVFAQGKQRGYRVYPGRNRQAFNRLGLRPGDLVLAINGTPLDDPARGQEIFRTLSSSSEAHVTVMRNGRQQDVTLNMAQVASEAEQLSTPESGVQPMEQTPQIPPADEPAN